MSRTMASLITTSLILCVAVAPGRGQSNNVTIDAGGSPTADLTDWLDETCFADDACDDFPNQQDATGACIASDFDTSQPATTAYLRFDMDDATVPGANTLDGCWLVDVNQNGFVDRALCFSLGGSPVDLISGQLFTCGDSSASACAMDMPVASSVVCAANSSTAGLDLFPVCAGPDTAVECSISLADLGWTSGVVSLLMGCTSTSSVPNSATFDCIADVGNSLIIDPESGTNTPVELLSFSVN